ncbi:hypothetical protein [Halomarina ordinaria]|uniref:Uncharacterized protein n=1 Tax=Halomarina ordinaria TaxID=3033939 RepID=A0ABD5UCF4_9EURY|nr:hypothetical protein [Halomarina sp. PSRA2]
MDELSEADVFDLLRRHCNPAGCEQRIVRVARPDAHGGVGSVLYSIEGGPPRGYALYIPDRRSLNVYNSYGRRVHVLTDTLVYDAPKRPTPMD